MNNEELRDLLELLYERYDRPEFVADDPISVPHRFSRQQDIEISGFLVSTIAWGNRKAIVKSGHRMVNFMGQEPYDFTMNATEAELEHLYDYVHRTFNGGDFRAFVLALRSIMAEYGSLGAFFEQQYRLTGDMRQVLSLFRQRFLAPPHPLHCQKHLSSIDSGAACKRLNMFLRWMVRRDPMGVDFGLWREIPASALYLPLDLHSGNMARQLGLLTRRQNDWKAVEEVTAALRTFDADDPTRYDFSLFGAGINAYFQHDGSGE